MNTLSHATWLADQGLGLFPVAYKTKIPEVNWQTVHTLAPACSGKPKQKHWFGGQPKNIGIHCGASQILVADEDKFGEFERLADSQEGDMPVTLTVASSRGLHWYYRTETPVTSSGAARRQGYQLDFKGDGGYVLGPGSVHPNGWRYQVIDGFPIAPAPDWLIGYLSPSTFSRPYALAYQSTKTDGSSKTLNDIEVARQLGWMRTAPPGRRNNDLFRKTCWFISASREDMMADLMKAAAVSGLGRDEIIRTVESARRTVKGLQP